MYDFTLNTPSALITWVGGTSTWNVQGNLRVGSSTLNLGDAPALVTVAGDVNVLETGALRCLNEDGSLEVKGDIQFDNPASFDTKAAVRLAGNEDQTISGGL
ncbi:hypothetical protein H8B13_10615 [Hymenobacter sp. BT188]|uniref:hypothetical protein n=1 Tax=Hymenobacter sp. BT188 TaxID=2763504 RepID=UPI0016514D6E|nr:hypothetical protein [Hymenobacter sp. BT188]MBC6607271.1 hypothetical protein [Hymenobacter sp. BT188]